jgi:hypothetical protein
MLILHVTKISLIGSFCGTFVNLFLKYEACIYFGTQSHVGFEANGSKPCHWTRTNLVKIIQFASDLNVTIGGDVRGLRGRQKELELRILETIGPLKMIEVIVYCKSFQRLKYHVLSN